MKFDPPVADLLHTLPPSLPQPPDRFEQVRTRVKRRRRRNITFSAALTALVVAAAIPTLSRLDGSENVTGRDPVQPAATATSPPVRTVELAPGATEVNELSQPVEGNFEGNVTVPLGDPPAGATDIAISLQCTSAGRFVYPDGASLTCDDRDAQSPGDPMPLPARYLIPIVLGQADITIDADPTARWRLVASYVATRTTAWGINANGQTYGVQNENGTPDLVRVFQKDTPTGFGYAYADDLNNPTDLPEPRTPEEAIEYTKATQGRTYDIPIYDTDGQTRIGTFTTG